MRELSYWVWFILCSEVDGIDHYTQKGTGGRKHFGRLLRGFWESIGEADFHQLLPFYAAALSVIPVFILSCVCSYVWIMKICFFRHHIFLFEFLIGTTRYVWGSLFIFHSFFLLASMVSCLQAAFRWATAMEATLCPCSWSNANQVFSVIRKTLWHCCWESP